MKILNYTLRISKKTEISILTEAKTLYYLFRWVDCVATTSSYFAFNIGYKYVTKYFDESTKQMVSSVQWNNTH